jgi:hypothetical protein
LPRADKKARQLSCGIEPVINRPFVGRRLF